MSANRRQALDVAATLARTLDGEAALSAASPIGAACRGRCTNDGVNDPGVLPSG